MSALPAGIKEGQWLKVDVPEHQDVASFLATVTETAEKSETHFTFERDEATSQTMQEKTQSLMVELSGQEKAF